MGQTTETQKTKNHDTIKNWVDDRNGKPAIVEGTEDSDNGDGLLRINFPNYSDQDLKEISWEKFFEIFDNSNVQFLYQEETTDGEKSRFFKFVGDGQ